MRTGTWGVVIHRCLSRMTYQDGPQELHWQTLARFIADECTPAERTALERSLATDPARAALVHALDVAVRVPDPAPPTGEEVERALARVRAQAVDARSGVGTRRFPAISLDVYRSRWQNARLAAAAAVLVVAGAGLVWRATIAPRSARMPAASATHFATAIGVLDSLQLPDGSRVLLGPGSEVVLAADFGAATRELTLTGEARFDVVHDASHPFVVHTRAASFRDVGTVFVVHSDEAEGARVVVTAGSVALEPHPGSPPTILATGDVAVVGAHGVVRVERHAGSSDDLAWMDGRLLFRDAPVAQVEADLRRWYGLELRVDSVLATRHLSAPFDRGSSASDVGRVVAAALGGVVHNENGVLHIIPRPAAQPMK